MYTVEELYPHLQKPEGITKPSIIIIDQVEHLVEVSFKLVGEVHPTDHHYLQVRILQIFILQHKEYGVLIPCKMELADDPIYITIMVLGAEHHHEADARLSGPATDWPGSL